MPPGRRRTGPQDPVGMEVDMPIHGLVEGSAHATASALRAPKRRSLWAKVSSASTNCASAEIRPQHLGEQHFGIGRLPEQEVRQTMFAGGADHQVWLGQRAGEKAAGEKFRRNGFGVEPPILGRACQFASGTGDLFLSAVIKGEGEVQTTVRNGAGFGVLDHPMDVAGHSTAMSDDTHPHALPTRPTRPCRLRK